VILNRSLVVHGSMSHLAQTSSQATIDVSSILKEWIWEGESDSDHESDNETASTTSGSRSPATTAASSFHEPPRHTKPIAHGVDHSMVSREVAEAFYGPFSRSNDYASHAEPSALPQEITQDVEMEDPDDRFNSDVMVFYHAATSSSEFDQVFDLAPSKSDHSHTLPPDSIYDPGCHVTDTEEFVEVFAKMRAQGMMDVEGGVRKVCSKVASKVGRKPGVAFPHQSGSGRTIYSP